MTDVFRELKESLGLPEADPKQMSGLALAVLGDTVYEALNRLRTVTNGDRPVRKLHSESIARANAKTQSKLVEVLEPLFTEEEKAVYRRGRNAEVYTKAKNASITEYHRATGLEAVIGYLFLTGETERLTALLKQGWETVGMW